MPRRKEDAIEDDAEKGSLWLSQVHKGGGEPLPVSSKLPKFVLIILGFSVIVSFGWVISRYGVQTLVHHFVTPTPLPTQQSIPTVTPVVNSVNQYYAWCMEKAFGMPYDPSFEGQEVAEEKQEFIDYCKSNFEDESTITCLPSDSLEYTELWQVTPAEEIEGVEVERLSDPSALVLPDNRIRTYYHSTINGIVSAISQNPIEASSTEAAFDVQITSITPRYRNPEAVLSPDGTYRLFAIRTDEGGGSVELFSFSSTDALTFQNEGVIINAEDYGMTSLMDFNIVQMDGHYRMFIVGGVVDTSVVVIADSEDAINWEVSPDWIDDSRVGFGSSLTAGELNQLTVLLQYGRNTCLSRSEDGLHVSGSVLVGNEYLYPEYPSHFAGDDIDITKIGDDAYVLFSFNDREAESSGDGIRALILQFAQ